MPPAAAQPDPAPRDVAIVIVNFNGRKHLERCLPAVFATAPAGTRVIVVDNASRDDSVAWLRAEFPAVTVLALDRNLGFGEANRRGILAAETPFVALLNSDTEPEPGWLAALLEPLLADPEVAASCALLRLMDHPGLLNAHGGGMTWLGYGFDRDFACPVPALDELPATSDTIFPTAAAAVLRRSDFLAAGGFDPAFFMYHEDVDLGWRLWLLGKRVVVANRALVRHAYGGTIRSHLGAIWRERLGSRHNVRSLCKNFEPYNLARAMKNLVKLWLRQRAWGHIVRVFVWNLWHLPGTLRQRAFVQRRRRRSDAELVAAGLVDEAPVPPPRPQLPRLPDTRSHWRRWIPGTSLAVGEDSALGRLGFGWYDRERDDGRTHRWTTGRAQCFLRATPSTSGRLEVDASFLAAAPEGDPLLVRVNGREERAAIAGTGWQTLSVPASSDADGVLDVELRSTPHVPHHLRGNWDFRRQGCAVRSLRFVPDPPPVLAAPGVSVVIPTYNRSRVLLRTLDALAAQSVPPDEVIVVDDGSTDATQDALQGWSAQDSGRLRLRALGQSNGGPGRARNRGVAAATGDLVLFLGDDTIPAPDLVAAHLEAHATVGEPCAVVGLTEWARDGMRATPFLEYVNRAGEQFAYDMMVDGRDIPFNCFYTSNVSLPRPALLAEPFDDSFPFAAWEDAEVGYRLSLAGLRIVYSAKARTSHLHPMTMLDFLRRQRKVGRTVEILFRLHPELRGDPAMPGTVPPWWFDFGRRLAPALAQGLSRWDGTNRKLPRRLYQFAILWAYFEGHREGPPPDAARRTGS